MILDRLCQCPVVDLPSQAVVKCPRVKRALISKGGSAVKKMFAESFETENVFSFTVIVLRKLKHQLAILPSL